MDASPTLGSCFGHHEHLTFVRRPNHVAGSRQRYSASSSACTRHLPCRCELFVFANLLFGHCYGSCRSGNRVAQAVVIVLSSGRTTPDRTCSGILAPSAQGDIDHQLAYGFGGRRQQVRYPTTGLILLANRKKRNCCGEPNKCTRHAPKEIPKEKSEQHHKW